MPDEHRAGPECVLPDHDQSALDSNAAVAIDLQGSDPLAIVQAIYSPCQDEYRTAGRAPAGSLLPASQAAQTPVADPLPTPPAMAWTWPPKLPNPCTMKCRPCPRTQDKTVGDVPGLYIQAGHPVCQRWQCAGGSAAAHGIARTSQATVSGRMRTARRRS